MKRRTKLFLAIAVGGVVVAVAGYIVCINTPLSMMAMLHEQSKLDAGTWEDDPKNWHRAFGEDPPEDVSVVHSYYWGSDHFTHEFIFFFEVKASATWREAFIESRNAQPVVTSSARRFGVHYDGTPEWFVPGQVEQYHVWDRPKYHGSLWMNKTNEHFYFYGVQL